MLVIVLIVVAIAIIYVFINKNKRSSEPATFTFLGKDSKGRSVFERREANGTTAMWKVVNGDKIEMNISDFNADKGTACFNGGENSRRYFVALEKGLVQAKDSNGEFERNSDGFVRYKDSSGNYVDNPDYY